MNDTEYKSIGSGPGLVIVQGTVQTALPCRRLAALLADSYTVHIPYRSENVAAVLRATGSTYLFGYSKGGRICLEAAAAAPGLRKLALYEPEAPAAASGVGTNGMNGIDTLLIAGSGSPSDVLLETLTLKETIPHSNVLLLPGMDRHAPDNFAPALMAEHLKQFFS